MDCPEAATPEPGGSFSGRKQQPPAHHVADLVTNRQLNHAVTPAHAVTLARARTRLGGDGRFRSVFDKPNVRPVRPGRRTSFDPHALPFADRVQPPRAVPQTTGRKGSPGSSRSRSARGARRLPNVGAASHAGMAPSASRAGPDRGRRSDHPGAPVRSKAAAGCPAFHSQAPRPTHDAPPGSRVRPGSSPA